MKALFFMLLVQHKGRAFLCSCIVIYQKKIARDASFIWSKNHQVTHQKRWVGLNHNPHHSLQKNTDKLPGLGA